MDEQASWENFLRTGSVEDYLHYCKARNQQLYHFSTEGADTGHATDNQWNRPAGPPDTRG